MEVRIVLDQSDPPVGRLGQAPGGSGANERTMVGFTGWLGLLRALSDVLEASDDQPPPPPEAAGDAT